MQISFILLIVPCILALITGADPGTTVKIRIEGQINTIYESEIFTVGRNVTTESGGTHHCDGMNLNSSSTPGPTATSALADAADRGHFTWDGTFSTQFDDFFITRIDKEQQTTTQFWGLLINFHYTQVGGCQTRVKLNDEVLFASDAFNKQFFLKLTGPVTVYRGSRRIFRVTDGSTGAPISGAKVDRYISDSNGHVNITFTTRGRKTLKAERSDSIRSNAIYVQVK